MKKIELAIIGITLMSLMGCKTPTQYIDPKNTSDNLTPSLNYNDFSQAAISLSSDIIANPQFAMPSADNNGRYILYISRISNDTMQHVDTDQLVKSMRVQLLNSGKFLVTTAFGEDSATRDMRRLENDPLIDQSTVKPNETVIAPDYSLSGKIIQRNSTLDDGASRIEYYFQLSLTEIATGLAFWEGEQVIAKISDNGTVSW